ncbi:hypothetical protein [Streptomyces sp. NPDC046161]|uniref:hypothetical protein n=1 Tax=Streptomyces sp. NPDC046161 TaxID=3155132 RepID=UPI0033F45F70
MTRCEKRVVPYGAHGSWANNQSKGRSAAMLNRAGAWVYTTPGAYSEDRDVDWNPVHWVIPC